MIENCKLPIQFDAERLLIDINNIADDSWLPHFNHRRYDGKWSVVPLRSVDGFLVRKTLR